MPFFSIIVPTYNRASLIKKTIDTLLAQTFTDFEIIVVDDGSTDNTSEVMAGISDDRVKYFIKENGERGIARNYGRAKATGQYVNFFDSDDLAYSNHLSTAMEFIKGKSQPEVFHLNYDSRNVDDVITFKGIADIGSVNTKLIVDNILSCNGVFIRKDIATQYPFPEDRRMAVSEDWALWLRLASRYTLWCVPVVTSSIVLHDQRSILDWNADKVIVRDKLMISYLFDDQEFVSYYKKGLNRFVADRYTFFMLLLAMKKRKVEVLGYAKEAVQQDFTVIFRKRFLASVKKILI